MLLSPPSVVVRKAASVLVVRDLACHVAAGAAVGGAPRRGAVEVLLLRRGRGAPAFANAWVFPGGLCEAADGGDARLTAARETFEEVGVLLARCRRAAARDDVRRDAALFARCAQGAHLSALARLASYTTPRAEASAAGGRRFDTDFFVALAPEKARATKVRVARAGASGRAGGRAGCTSEGLLGWGSAMCACVETAQAERGALSS